MTELSNLCESQIIVLREIINFDRGVGALVNKITVERAGLESTTPYHPINHSSFLAIRQSSLSYVFGM